MRLGRQIVFDVFNFFHSPVPNCSFSSVYLLRQSGGSDTGNSRIKELNVPRALPVLREERINSESNLVRHVPFSFRFVVTDRVANVCDTLIYIAHSMNDFTTSQCKFINLTLDNCFSCRPPIRELIAHVNGAGNAKCILSAKFDQMSQPEETSPRTIEYHSSEPPRKFQSVHAQPSTKSTAGSLPTR